MAPKSDLQFRGQPPTFLGDVVREAVRGGALGADRLSPSSRSCWIPVLGTEFPPRISLAPPRSLLCPTCSAPFPGMLLVPEPARLVRLGPLSDNCVVNIALNPSGLFTYPERTALATNSWSWDISETVPGSFVVAVRGVTNPISWAMESWSSFSSALAVVDGWLSHLTPLSVARVPSM